MRVRARSELWANRDFVRLWSAGTVSVFGSFVTRTALPFAAILVLHAGAAEISVLRALELVAALVVGLAAGAWVDRLRRRPIMITADLGRAVLLGSIPLAALGGVLQIGQLFVVAYLAATLTTFFDVADQAFLPTVVPASQVVPANAAINASSAAAEFSAFGISGFLIQLFTAPIAIAVDAVSFVVSAVLLGTIRGPEPARASAREREPVLTEIRAGLRLVSGNPTIRAIAGAEAAAHALWGVFGVTYLLFATQVVGLGPATIGLIAGVGGASSFLGAIIAPRASRRLGLGRTLMVGMLLFIVGSAFIPLAPSGAPLVGGALLVLQQFVGDSGYTVFEIGEVSLRHSIVDDHLMGRVNGTIRFFETVVQLGATMVGGIIAEALGLRLAMVAGLMAGTAALVFLWFSPIRGMRGMARGGAELARLPAEELPITE